MATKNDRENDFWEESPVHSEDTLGVKNRQNRSFLHCFQCSFVFFEEIHVGCPKWRENNFWEKSPVDSVDTGVGWGGGGLALFLR